MGLSSGQTSVIDPILEVEQGCHDQLHWAEPEALRNTIQSLQNGFSPLDDVLEQEQIRP